MTQITLAHAKRPKNSSIDTASPAKTLNEPKQRLTIKQLLERSRFGMQLMGQSGASNNALAGVSSAERKKRAKQLSQTLKPAEKEVKVSVLEPKFINFPFKVMDPAQQQAIALQKSQWKQQQQLNTLRKYKEYAIKQQQLLMQAQQLKQQANNSQGSIKNLQNLKLDLSLKSIQQAEEAGGCSNQCSLCHQHKPQTRAASPKNDQNYKVKIDLHKHQVQIRSKNSVNAVQILKGYNYHNLQKVYSQLQNTSALLDQSRTVAAGSCNQMNLIRQQNLLVSNRARNQSLQLGEHKNFLNLSQMQSPNKFRVEIEDCRKSFNNASNNQLPNKAVLRHKNHEQGRLSNNLTSIYEWQNLQKQTIDQVFSYPASSNQNSVLNPGTHALASATQNRHLPSYKQAALVIGAGTEATSSKQRLLMQLQESRFRSTIQK